MRGTLHIVGAGVAGLAAALAASARGQRVSVYEASPQAGGRCRTVEGADGFRHDNGTHVLLTANRRALTLLDSIGAREGWIEPEPEGLPLFDAASGTLHMVGLSPWSWFSSARRPPGLRLADLPALLRLSLPFGDPSVGQVVRDGPLRRSLIEPLTVAVLNTPVEVASARRLGRALARVVRPGGARLLVAKEGLSANLVEPALAALRADGATIRFGARLKGLTVASKALEALQFTQEPVALAPEDSVIFALPPAETARLVPSVPVPDAYEAIVNLHYRTPGPERPRFVGLIGTLAQWALIRPDHLSVTISAAGEAADRDPDDLARTVWAELGPALKALDLPWAEAVPPSRVVKEKRATLRQASGARFRPVLRPFVNAALAGDWLGDLPATIEAAVVSGERAVSLLWAR